MNKTSIISLRGYDSTFYNEGLMAVQERRWGLWNDPHTAVPILLVYFVKTYMLVKFLLQLH